MDGIGRSHEWDKKIHNSFLSSEQLFSHTNDEKTD